MRCTGVQSRVGLATPFQLSGEKPKQTIYANVYWNRINNRDSQMFLSPIFFKGGGICTQAMYWWENWCWSLLRVWGIIKHLCYRGCLPETGPGCKENHFYSLPSGQAELAFTSPVVISASPKSFLTSRIHFTILLLFEFLKKITCASGKLKTEFTSRKAKSTSPGLSDTTFFARWGQTCSSHNSHRTS